MFIWRKLLQIYLKNNFSYQVHILSLSQAISEFKLESLSAYPMDGTRGARTNEYGGCGAVLL